MNTKFLSLVIAAGLAGHALAEDVAVPFTDTSICTYDGSPSHDNYPVKLAFNGNRTDRWLAVSNVSDPRYAQASFSTGWRFKPTKLILTGLKDTKWSERDPKRFILRASNDGETWDVLRDEKDISKWEVSQVREWDVTAGKAYSMFRLEIPETQGVDQYRGLSEIEMMCDPAATELGGRKPARGEVNVTHLPTFAWGARQIANVTYRVYLGETEELGESDRVAETAELQATLPAGVFLKPATTYYWRVDTVLEDGAVIAGVVWPFTVFARSETPIAVENFEKLDVGALNGQGPSGNGWTGAWWAAHETSEVVEKKLEYRKGKIRIDGGKYALRVSKDGRPAVSRPFEKRGDSPIYVGFLFNGHIPANAQRILGVYLNGNTENADCGTVGADLFWSSGKANAVIYAYNTTPVRGSCTTASAPDETHFVIVKMTANGYDEWGGNSYANCYIYVDPSTLEEPEKADAQASTARSGAYYFDKLYMRLYNFKTDDYAFVDEIRVGSTWRSVIPDPPKGFLLLVR